MKKFFTPTLVVILTMLFVMVSSCGNNDNSNTNSSNTDKPSSLPRAKVYVANEAGGSVSVIDLQDSLKTTSIDLSDSAGTMFMTHNVQVPPMENLFGWRQQVWTAVKQIT